MCEINTYTNSYNTVLIVVYVVVVGVIAVVAYE